ncbi:peptide chain release factor N(5)-glutamine methyltransferase [Candidatus Saccharibacteria bacterium]|nr:peptide chain release factor N(5)-glutamine methyltransferase [Candidatus Saccharibacteria bacterium]
MKIKDYLNSGSERGINRGELEILISKRLGLSRTEIILKEDEDLLADENILQLDNDIKRRLAGEPLAYILGTREFYGRDFLVDKNVLIPRPETEVMIDVVKKIAASEARDLKILDVGTGSGCIAVTLKLELEGVKVLAVDVSKSALEVARDNAKRLGAEVEFIESSLLEKVEAEDFDIVTANLPYVDKSWDWLSRRDLASEPELALYAEDGGLALIFELINQVKKQLRPGTYLALECDVSQQDRLIMYAKNLGLELIQKNGYITVFRLN